MFGVAPRWASRSLGCAEPNDRCRIKLLFKPSLLLYMYAAGTGQLHRLCTVHRHYNYTSCSAPRRTPDLKYSGWLRIAWIMSLC